MHLSLVVSDKSLTLSGTAIELPRLAVRVGDPSQLFACETCIQISVTHFQISTILHVTVRQASCISHFTIVCSSFAYFDFSPFPFFTPFCGTQRLYRWFSMVVVIVVWWLLLLTGHVGVRSMRRQNHAFPQMSPPRVHGHPVSQTCFHTTRQRYAGRLGSNPGDN